MKYILVHSGNPFCSISPNNIRTKSVAVKIWYLRDGRLITFKVGSISIHTHSHYSYKLWKHISNSPSPHSLFAAAMPCVTSSNIYFRITYIFKHNVQHLVFTIENTLVHVTGQWLIVSSIKVSCYFIKLMEIPFRVPFLPLRDAN
jgi:hypothetical protein